MKRSKVTKRVLAVILSLTMVMSNLSVSATEISGVTDTVIETSVETNEVGASEDVVEVEETVNVLSADSASIATIESEATFNASNEASGTYSESFVDQTGYFLVTATSGSTVVIEDNSKGNYSRRLKTGGEGKITNRSIGFATSNAATITAKAMSSSSSADRVVQILNSEGEQVATTDLIASKDIVEISLSVKKAGTYYIASTAGGVNFYEVNVKIESGSSSDDDNNDNKEPEDVSVSGDIYVAPNATGDGSKENPADLVKAIESLQAGHTIHMAEGTYSYSNSIIIPESNSGSADAMKSIIADGEVTIDFSGMGYTGSEENKSQRGIILDGSYWYIKGVTISGAADNGMLLSGDNNTLELCVFAYNHDSGLQVSRYQTGYDDISQWPSNNLILNCSSHDNVDSTGENADGFAAKLTCGEGNIFDGCLSYCNSDDGWDLYAKTATGKIGVVTIRNCIAFRNGKLSDGTGSASGDMNGFKLGSSQGVSTSTPHVVINCIAFENGAHGFTDNGNQSGIKLINCTSINNSYYSGSKCANFQMNRESGGYNINLLSYASSKIGTDGFIGTVEDSVYYNNSTGNMSVVDSTAFNGKEKLGTKIDVTASDFVSLTLPDPATTDFHKVWRNADGTLNLGDFLKLSSSSDLTKMASDGASLGQRMSEGTMMTEEPENTNGGGSSNKEEDDDKGDDKPVVSGETVAHSFTANGLVSEVFTITNGTLSTSKGSVEYNGETLTTCLKIESKTSIKFTAADGAKLVLVFNENENRSIKIDGVITAITEGILETELTEGEHEITKKDSVNLYYIALVYPTQEEEKTLPEVDKIEDVDTTITAFDLGAEALDSTKYNNVLTADVINSWYPGVEAGTAGKNIATFTVKDSDGNVIFGFNDGTYSTTHRLRTSNTALTRYDVKEMQDSEGNTLTGFIYSNKSKTDAVNVQVALKAGQVMTAYVGSNSSNATVAVKSPSGEVQTFAHTFASSNSKAVATKITYYPTEDGLYTIYSVDEKLLLARVLVENTQSANVVGFVSAPESLTETYSVVFTNKTTGAATTAEVVDGTYAAVLTEGFSYDVALENAEGYIVTSADEVEVKATEDHYNQFDITVDAVTLVKLAGSIVGLSAEAASKLVLTLESDEIYVPTVEITGTSYKATVQANVEYKVVIANVDDYVLANPSTIKVSEDSTQDITFEAKTLYDVTINPTGASTKDLADATFTFTRHSDSDVTAEEDYVYTFVGTDNIKLRNGVYTVKVTNSGDYKQKLTSNLVVKDAAVTKTVPFEFTGDTTQPKTWDFSSDEYTGQADFNGATIVNGKKHSANYGMVNKNGSITVPVNGNSSISVVVGYTWDILVDGEDEILQTSDGGSQTLNFNYEGSAGTFTIKTGTQTTSYIKSVTVTPVSENTDLPTSWDFRTDEYTGQAEFNGLLISGGKKHGSSYGMMIKNGSVEVPVAGSATIKVSVGYNWDITFEDGTNYLENTNSDTVLVYEYTGKAGKTVISVGSQVTSYIKAIEVVSKESTEVNDVVLTVGAKDCDYTTINDALNAVKKMNRKSGQRAVISIQPGNYEEMLVIDVANVTLKNASETPSIETKNQGVDIDDNAVRITWYYGHGYTYYSMDKNCKYNADLLAVNKENGYPSYVNPGSGTTDGSYWNATVVVAASGFEADGIIFENSFNQYISEKAAEDVLVAQSGAKEGSTPRASMKAGDVTVQNKKYVERAAALAITNNCAEIFFNNCKFIGRQDTLYGGINVTAAFQKCDIYGGTDYIFGGMTAVFAKCNLVANTMEDSNDTFYITAAQQKSGRGYLMYNCNVVSTIPGVDTASEKVSKVGYFGRPWQATTSEVVFYATNIGASSEGTSLIAPAGWLSTLGGESENVYEIATNETVADTDNSASRVSWAKTYEAADSKLADGSAITFETFLGSWNPFDEGMDKVDVLSAKDLRNGEVSKEDDKTTTTVFTLDANSDLTAFAAGAKADGDSEKAGTENYFTIIYSAKSKVDSSSKTFDDGYAATQRINLGGVASTSKNAVKFTTSNPATVKIWWVEGGDDNRQIAILDSEGNQVAVTNETVAKNATVISKLELAEAGTYYLGGATNNNYIFKIEVTEEAKTVVNEYEFEALNLTAFAAGAKADGDSEKAGTDNFFTLIFSAKSKVDSSSKTFDDGYTSAQRVNFGGVASLEKNAIKFTTEGTATVKIWWAEGGDDNRQLVILDSNGNEVVRTSETLAKNAVAISTLELQEAGTYYLGNVINNNYIFKVYVEDVVGGKKEEVKKTSWNEVAAPEITAAAVSTDKASIDVTVKMLIDEGIKGAEKVTVYMLDEDGNVVSSKSSIKAGEEQTYNFVPTASGTYKFYAEASRENEEAKKTNEAKVNFTLPLVGANVKSATNKGNGSVEVAWDAVSEATSYIVLVNGEEYKETSDLVLVVKGLTVGEEYTFGVKAVRAEKIFGLFTISKEVSATTGTTMKALVKNEVERTWAFAAFGQGVDTKNNGYKGSVNDGSVTVYSEGGKGKIVPASNDGLAFYYTAMDADKENFTMTADVHVDSWTFSNGQEGFGIMVADAVGANGYGTNFWNNSYQVLASKIEYYYDRAAGEVTTDTSAEKITMKLGLGYNARTGVTAADVEAFSKNGVFTFADGSTGSIPENFVAESSTLETNGATTGARNIVGNATKTVENTMENAITDFKLQIQRNNTGYFLRYLDNDGNVIMEKKYYDLDRSSLAAIDSDNVYVGFFASRNARITVTNVELTVIDPADDAPAEEREIEYVYPNYTIESATTANSSNYTLTYVANADGEVTIVNKTTGKTVVKKADVTANTKMFIKTEISTGVTEFEITMTPDKDYAPGEYQRLTSYDAVTFTHTVDYEKFEGNFLYVAPNGSETNTGAKDSPLDIYTAVKYVAAGQTIVLAGGEYSLSRTVKVERGISGIATNMIYMIADPNATERPVFNFNGKCAGMVFAGDYWYVSGFDCTKSANGQKGIQVSGSHNTLDGINAYMNGNTGIQISRYLGTDAYDQWPSYNLILNCSSYLNADAGYEDADGFAAKLTVADGNVFDGCIAAYNADDGWDLFAKAQSGSIGSVTIKNCVTFKNGYVLTVDGKKYSELSFTGLETDAGNGNGFKMGGDSMPGAHVLVNSVAFENKAKGFDSNSCPDIKIYNSTTFNNEGANVAFYTNTAVNTAFFADGVLSFKTANDVVENIKAKGTQNNADIYGVTNYYTTGKEASSNTEGKSVAKDWFVSLTRDASVGLYGISRNADGTINMNGFLELTSAVPTGVGAVMTGSASKTFEVIDEEPLPFEEKNGNLYYVVDGKVQRSAGLISVNSKYYYVNWAGVVIRDSFGYKVAKTNGLGLAEGKYVIDENGVIITSTGLYDYKGDTYFLNNGVISYSTGVEELNGSFYYVMWNGHVVKNSFGYLVAKTNNSGLESGKYWIDENGVINTTTGLVDYENNTYVLNNGVISYSTGVEEVDGYFYYVMWNGHVVKNSKAYLIAKTNESGISFGFHAIDADGKILDKDGNPYTK